MRNIWSIIYNLIVIPALYIFLQIASLFNQKIKRGIRGRRRIFEQLIIDALSIDKAKGLIWFHSSSLGEFEQAKPIIQAIKKNSDINILITFFSPSGYENSRKYPYADLISYLPFDSKSNSERFMQIVKPDLAILMRYDIWPNIIWSIKKFKIPSIIVDATMRPDSLRKVPFVKSFHKVLFKSITEILTVSESDVSGFKEFGCGDQQVKAVGDTRFDRVYERSLKAKEKNLLKEDIIQTKKVLVAGSTWEADEEILFPALIKLTKYEKNLLFIIAPHEPTLIHLEKIENEFSKHFQTIRFSHLNNYNNEQLIIIDSIGILLTLYTYADIAYVGGGFKQNVHNVLEAAVYGVPVMFGPKIENSQEAQELLKRGGGMMIRNKREAYRSLRQMFANEGLRESCGKIANQYVQENLGATQKILKEIYKVVR
jgi:3-deoxy-D-manno-octulosonic-acid transferase